MKEGKARQNAIQASRGARTVFVCEWADEPGRYGAVAEREYYADDTQGQFFREAIAEYHDGHEVT